MTRIYWIIPFLMLCFSSVLAQNRFGNHSGFIFGIEIGNYLALPNTYPSEQPGYTFGYFTSLYTYSGEVHAVNLNFEVNYSSIASNRIGVSQIFNTDFPRGVNYTVWNEHFRLSFAEVAVGPQYSTVIFRDLIFTVHASFFLGIGRESLKVYQLSHTLTADTTISGYPTYAYGPYGEYGMQSVRFPFGVSIGFRLVWDPIILDSRFKQTGFDKSKSIMPIPKAFFVSLGFLL